MADPKIVLLPGDGIGPEVVSEAARALELLCPDVVLEEHLIGGAALDATGAPLPPAAALSLRPWSHAGEVDHLDVLIQL